MFCLWIFGNSQLSRIKVLVSISPLPPRFKKNLPQKSHFINFSIYSMGVLFVFWLYIILSTSANSKNDRRSILFYSSCSSTFLSKSNGFWLGTFLLLCFNSLILSKTRSVASSICKESRFNASIMFLLSAFIFFDSSTLNKTFSMFSILLSLRTYDFSGSIVFSGYLIFLVVFIYISF